MANPTLLYDVCAGLMAAINTEFAADGVTLPTTQFIDGSGGGLAVCESLVVTWEHIGAATPGTVEAPVPMGTNARGFGRQAVILVHLYRCMPTLEGEGPQLLEAIDPAAETAAAQIVMTDAYELHRIMWRALRDGTFLEPWKGLFVGQAVPIPREGGIGGTQLTLTVELS
jgi:hypothetical protein